MLYNISESWIFRGVLSCNELRAGREKLSTIGGGRNGGKLSCLGLAWYDFWTYICKRKMWRRCRCVLRYYLTQIDNIKFS